MVSPKCTPESKKVRGSLLRKPTKLRQRITRVLSKRKICLDKDKNLWGWHLIVFKKRPTKNGLSSTHEKNLTAQVCPHHSELQEQINRCKVILDKAGTDMFEVDSDGNPICDPDVQIKVEPLE